MIDEPRRAGATLYDLDRIRAERERVQRTARAPVIQSGSGWYHAAAIREAEKPRER